MSWQILDELVRVCQHNRYTSIAIERPGSALGGNNSNGGGGSTLSNNPYHQPYAGTAALDQQRKEDERRFEIERLRKAEQKRLDDERKASQLAEQTKRDEAQA